MFYLQQGCESSQGEEMKCRIIVEVDRTNTSWKDVNHTDSHNLAIDEVLLVEWAKTLCGHQRAFAKEPFELAGIALVNWVAMNNLRMKFGFDYRIAVDQPADSSGRV